jgi:hypothetical protein
MRTLRQAVVLAVAGVLASVPALSAAEEIHPGEQSFLGLTGPQIPDILKAVAADPYKAPASPACATIPAEILALDEVLGADVDQAQPKKSYVKSFAIRQAKGAVRGLIPYRGAIRFLTGADHKDHELMAAAQAGFARRGFLRGLEANLHCAEPAQPVATPPVAEPAPIIRRVETAYAPQPAEPAEGDAHDADGKAATELGTVMLAEPRGSSAEQPGR